MIDFNLNIYFLLFMFIFYSSLLPVSYVFLNVPLSSFTKLGENHFAFFFLEDEEIFLKITFSVLYGAAYSMPTPVLRM